MDTTNAVPLIAPATGPDGAPPAGLSPLDLASLSVRELICELAAT